MQSSLLNAVIFAVQWQSERKDLITALAQRAPGTCTARAGVRQRKTVEKVRSSKGKCWLLINMEYSSTQEVGLRLPGTGAEQVCTARDSSRMLNVLSLCTTLQSAVRSA